MLPTPSRSCLVRTLSSVVGVGAGVHGSGLGEAVRAGVPSRPLGMARPRFEDDVSDGIPDDSETGMTRCLVVTSALQALLRL